MDDFEDLPLSERSVISESYLKRNHVKQALVTFRSGNIVGIVDGEVEHVLMPQDKKGTVRYEVVHSSPSNIDDDVMYAFHDYNCALRYVTEFISIKLDMEKKRDLDEECMEIRKIGKNGECEKMETYLFT